MIRPTETAAMKTSRLSILAWHVKPRQLVCGIASVNRFKAALRCRKHCCRMAVAVTVLSAAFVLRLWVQSPSLSAAFVFRQWVQSPSLSAAFVLRLWVQSPSLSAVFVLRLWVQSPSLSAVFEAVGAAVTVSVSAAYLFVLRL